MFTLLSEAVLGAWADSSFGGGNGGNNLLPPRGMISAEGKW